MAVLIATPPAIRDGSGGRDGLARELPDDRAGRERLHLVGAVGLVVREGHCEAQVPRVGLLGSHGEGSGFPDVESRQGVPRSAGAEDSRVADTPGSDRPDLVPQGVE